MPVPAPPYRLYTNRLDDFEARIRVLTKEEGGRSTPAYNGIRWDLRYADQADANELYVIHPDFYDELGESLLLDWPLPTDQWLYARLFILNDQLRQQIHQKKVRPGTSFYCCEGARIVAEGTVTRLTGLFTPRPML